MRYYIIAGEKSGDLHASNLLKYISLYDKKYNFRGFGGNNMKSVGVNLSKELSDLQIMGFYEIFFNLKKIFRNLSFCKKDIRSFNPDLIILVDYSGFNLKISKFAKNNNFKVVYYISPKVWAWNKSRIKKIKRNVNAIYCILPFEKEFFLKYNCEVEYFGNPLLDSINNYKINKSNFRFDKKNNKHIVALLPGSRESEILHTMPYLIQLPNYFPNCEFYVACSNNINKEIYRKFSNNSKIYFIYNQTYDLLSKSHVAIVTSGTATLEAALFKIPQLVIYKTSFLSFIIAKIFIKVKFISLVNLILNKNVVTEIIQYDLSINNLLREFNNLFIPEKRISMIKSYDILIKKMGKNSPSKKIAKSILKKFYSET